MISLLTPSRGRVAGFERMFKSAYETAERPEQVEVVARFDDDDPASAAAAMELGAVVVVGPRIRNITDLWNECYRECRGEIVGQLNDDVVFRTKGWDTAIAAEFEKVPDGILMVHGDHLGGYDGRLFGPHPFVSRRWVEALGYFIPPYFSSDHGDTWVNDVANALGRRKFIPVVIEHMHFGVGKAEVDQTTRDRLQHHAEDNPEKLYEFKLPERVAAARTLGKLMTPPKDIVASRFFGTRSAGECPRCHSGSTVFAGDQLACNACGHWWKM